MCNKEGPREPQGIIQRRTHEAWSKWNAEKKYYAPIPTPCILNRMQGNIIKTKLADKYFDDMAKLKYLGMMLKFQILLTYKLKADKIRRIQPNIPTRTFCITTYNPKIWNALHWWASIKPNVLKVAFVVGGGALRLAINTHDYYLPVSIACSFHNELLSAPRLRITRLNLTSAGRTATTSVFPRQDTGTSWQIAFWLACHCPQAIVSLWRDWDFRWGMRVWMRCCLIITCINYVNPVTLSYVYMYIYLYTWCVSI